MELGPHALAAYPQLSALIMEVIACWGHIDGSFSAILANLLKADVAIGASMYQALTGGEARKAALLAAATTALSAEDFRYFQAVLKIAKPSRDRRNEFAHDIWALSPDIPDALLLMNARVVMDHNVYWRQFIEDNKQPIEVVDGQVRYVVKAPVDLALDASRVFVYRESDLRRDLVAARDADHLVSLLWDLTSTIESASARRSLSTEPRIVSILQSPNP